MGHMTLNDQDSREKDALCMEEDTRMEEQPTRGREYKSKWGGPLERGRSGRKIYIFVTFDRNSTSEVGGNTASEIHQFYDF